MGTIQVCFIIGFIAQIIDGSLGMAYGVCANTFLLLSGFSPVIASASVHSSEVFTTLVSGISHFHLKNIDKVLIKKLVIPGMLGGIVGAYILTNISGEIIKPFVNVYLIYMGVVIVLKAIKNSVKVKNDNDKIWILGLFAGFFDAVGGGGWGPIATSTLLSKGYNARYAIGSVNISEFFVTFVQAIAFISLIGISQNWRVILGLALGGVIAAPLSAFMCKKLPQKLAMLLVGILILVLNVRGLVLLMI